MCTLKDDTDLVLTRATCILFCSITLWGVGPLPAGFRSLRASPGAAAIAVEGQARW